MLKRWIGFILCLVGALAYYQIYTGYISELILLTVLGLPFVSLLVSLPVMLTVRIEFADIPARVSKNAEVKSSLAVKTGIGLPVAKLRGSYSVLNLTFGNREQKFGLVERGYKSGKLPIFVDTSEIGLIRLGVKRFYVFDYLGLFLLPVKKPDDRYIAVLPDIIAPEKLPELANEATLVKPAYPKPGGGYSEEHELRSYKVGDSMNSIHWKLSSKHDELITREPVIREKSIIVVAYNAFGTEEEAESTFGQISYIVRNLTSKGLGLILFRYGKEGEPIYNRIAEAKDYDDILVSLFNDRFEASGKSAENTTQERPERCDLLYFVKPCEQKKEEAR